MLMCVLGEGSEAAFRYQLLLRGTDRNDRNTSLSKRSPIPQQIRVGNCSYLLSDVCVQMLWKAIPFAIECKLTVTVTVSEKKFTESVNVRRETDKWCRSAFGAAVGWIIDQSWNYIWVTEKLTENVASRTSKIILVFDVNTSISSDYRGLTSEECDVIA
jgi:hypothetical protein